jgi:pullulanase/glycogen debranching enzyme
MLDNAERPAGSGVPRRRRLRNTRPGNRLKAVRLPLGVTWIEEQQAFNFAVHSEHAESVALLLFSATDLVNPVLTFRFDFLHNKSGRIWHCRIPITEIGEASLLRIFSVGRDRSSTP